MPATTTLERNDIGASGRDRFVLAMKKAIEPIGESRSDFEIFGGLARELGVEEPFSEGRNEFEWLEHMYQVAHQRAAQTGHDMPQFDEFWRTGYVEFPKAEAPFVLYEAFAQAPQKNPLATPSGKSRSSRRLSTVSITTTVVVTPCGLSPMSGWGEREPKTIRYTSFPTSRNPDCTGRWITPR